MSFNWLEYLQLAQQLSGNAKISASRESRLRSAISRAYYSVFIQARNYLRDREGLAIPLKNSHRYIIQTFKTHANIDYREIGNNLERLRIRRNQADYDDIFKNLPKITTRSLKLAMKTIAKLQTL
ncbi:MAG: HEPN domain-containing protein [Spirulina sp.]